MIHNYLKAGRVASNRAAEAAIQNQSVEWVHVCLRNPVPPTFDGSYNHLLWELLLHRKSTDIVIGEYFPASWQIAQEADAPVIQVDTTTAVARDRALYSIRRRLQPGVARPFADRHFLKHVADVVQRSAARQVLVWGAIHLLPCLRQLLRNHTIAFAQRHYDYRLTDCHYDACDLVVMQTPGQLRHAFRRLNRFCAFPVIIPNGVDTHRFSPPTAEQRNYLKQQFGIHASKRVVLFPSKLAEHKGSRYLVRWIQSCALEEERIHFLVVGDLHSSLPTSHRAEVERVLGTSPNVSWTRGLAQRDMPMVYKAADLCIMPATCREGFSMSAIEAMASGLPIVASHTGCYSEIVEHGYNGILCAPERLFTQGLEALVHLAKNLEYGNEIGRNARTYVEQYLTRTKQIRNFLAFLDGNYKSIDDYIAPVPGEQRIRTCNQPASSLNLASY